MAVADYTASASTLSTISGSFTEPPYGDAFSTTAAQFVHSGGFLQRSGAGFGSFTWGTTVGPDVVAGYEVGGVGELDLIVRGKDIGGAGWDGYDAYYDNAGGWELYRVINGASTLLTSASATFAVSDTLWMVAIDNGSSVDIAVALERSGSVGADFISATDSTSLRLTNAGYIGAWANGTSFKIATLYGATAVAASSGTSHSMTAAVAGVSSFTASGMNSTRGVSATAAGVSSFTASGMNSTRGVSATVAGVSAFSAGLAAEYSLSADINAVSTFSATGMESTGIDPLDAAITAVSTFSATGLVLTRLLTADIAAVSSFTATTLLGTGLDLLPVSDPGGLVLTPYSDPGGLTLTPYSDPSGLTLTPIS